MHDITDLAQEAARHHGLLFVDTLHRAGVSTWKLSRMVAKGALVRLRPGVFHLVGASPSWEASLAAVCLGRKPHAVASHRSALRLWGLRTIDDEIEATVRYPRSSRVEGATIHRSADLRLDHVTFVEEIPVTNPVRTLCDAGLIFPEHEVRRMVSHALATDLVTRSDLWRFRIEVGRQGRNGVGRLHRVLEDLPSGAERAESGPEVELLQICQSYGLPEPAVQFPIVVGGRRYRVDLAYPEARVLIEFDGYEAHADPTQFVDDRRRQNDLVLTGWSVLRFTYPDLRDGPAAVAAKIRQSIAAWPALPA